MVIVLHFETSLSSLSFQLTYKKVRQRSKGNLVLVLASLLTIIIGKIQCSIKIKPLNENKEKKNLNRHVSFPT